MNVCTSVDNSLLPCRRLPFLSAKTERGLEGNFFFRIFFAGRQGRASGSRGGRPCCRRALFTVGKDLACAKFLIACFRENGHALAGSLERFAVGDGKGSAVVQRRLCGSPAYRMPRVSFFMEKRCEQLVLPPCRQW